MPNHIKYTKEQRKKVHEMYWEGRTIKRQSKDVYSLEYISKCTGVNANSVQKIAAGVF